MDKSQEILSGITFNNLGKTKDLEKRVKDLEELVSKIVMFIWPTENKNKEG